MQPALKIGRGRGRPKGSKNKPKTGIPLAGEGSQNFTNLRISANQPQTISAATTKSANHNTTHRTYTPLAKTSLGNTELYNLYGIVIDASSPHPKKNFFR